MASIRKLDRQYKKWIRYYDRYRNGDRHPQSRWLPPRYGGAAKIGHRLVRAQLRRPAPGAPGGSLLDGFVDAPRPQ